MRQWSEEQRSGTLEMLMTLPVAPWQLVLGKFLAVMALVGVALLLTLPIPAVVAMLGPLDWGPVLGGYLAALLLAAAYAALGLWLSALTDNPIVALLATAVIGGLLYLLGTPVVTGLTGAPWNDVLRAAGTGSRFESIERGVIDLRDLLYYLSLCAFFLLLTVYHAGPQAVGQRGGDAALSAQREHGDGAAGGQPAGPESVAGAAGGTALGCDGAARVHAVADHQGTDWKSAGAAADARLYQQQEPSAARPAAAAGGGSAARIRDRREGAR